MQGRKVTVPTTIRVRYPGAFRVDSDMPAGRLTQVFDSGTFWVQDARGATVAPPGAAESMRGNVQRDSIALLLALADGRVKARRGSDVTIEGRALPVLDVDIKPGGPLSLVFDPATGLILRQRYPPARRPAVTSKKRSPITATSTVSRWRSRSPSGSRRAR